MHEVDAALPAFPEEHERSQGIAAKRFLLVIFAPIDVRASRFSRAIDDDVGVMMIEFFANLLRICDISIAESSLRIHFLEMSSKVAFWSK